MFHKSSCIIHYIIWNRIRERFRTSSKGMDICIILTKCPFHVINLEIRRWSNPLWRYRYFYIIHYRSGLTYICLYIPVEIDGYLHKYMQEFLHRYIYKLLDIKISRDTFPSFNDAKDMCIFIYVFTYIFIYVCACM